MKSLMEKSLNLDYVKLSTKWWTNLVWMIDDQNLYDTCFTIFYPTASATAYGQRPKFVRAKHSATAEGENCAYGTAKMPISRIKILVDKYREF